jgi:hypothetical protein
MEAGPDAIRRELELVRQRLARNATELRGRIGATARRVVIGFAILAALVALYRFLRRS